MFERLRGAVAAVLLVQCLVISTGGTRLPDALTSNMEGSSFDSSERKAINHRPLIGILTQPGSPAPKHSTYIAASYVRFVQAAGARAVPIQCDLPRDEIKRRFEKVNGLLIPGGGQDLSPGHPYYDATQQLLELAIAANDAGDYFPIQATCLGWEALAAIVSRNASILSTFDAEDLPSPLFLAEDGHSSRFWRALPRRIQLALAEQPLTMENHVSGVTAEAFDASPKLWDFFTVISTSEDRQGREYISTVEATEYPFTATQWHPEKNAFEWSHELHIPHTGRAVEVALEVAKYLVKGARRNAHAPKDDDEERDLLIYNWPVIYTGRQSSRGGGETGVIAFDECYMFKSESADASSTYDDAAAFAAAAATM